MLELTAKKFIVDYHLEDQGKGNMAHRSRQKHQTGKFGISSGSSKLPLGTLASIKVRSRLCSFCRLVLRSIEEHPNRQEDAVDDDAAECFASWEIDGRQITKRKDGFPVATRARTRRIHLHWPGYDFQDSYIVLVAPDSWGSEGLFFGRPVDKAEHNPALAKRWTDLCCASHGKVCEPERGRAFNELINKAFFGVLDVDLMYLTSLPPNGRYVALSYTWGTAEPNKQPFKSTLNNFHVLHHRGGVQIIQSKLPRVIRDAITLVKSMGERYLWVDSLSIVQDSNSSWDLNAGVMDIVYGGAHLTICAADGDGADAGLKGLDSSARIFTQHIEEYDPGFAPPVDLMVSHLAETYINQSEWNKRGWTFQERMLSKRCLVFVDGRMYFQCRTMTMCEDIYSEDPDAGWSMELGQAPTRMLSELVDRPIQVYAESVELYTSRQLSMSKDILNAFNGMRNLIGNTLRAHLVHGLPNSHFDWAFLWETQEIDTRNPIERRDPQKFPTWSWCGWIGGAMAYKSTMVEGTLINLHEWLMEHTWIVWYIRDGYGSLRLVWNENYHHDEGKRRLSRWQGYAYQCNSDPDPWVDPYGRLIPEERRDLTRSKFNLTLPPEYPYSVNIDSRRSEPYIQFPDLLYLQFWTWSAHLRLTFEGTSGTPMVRRLRRYGISDHKGDWCGTIVLDPGRLRYHKDGNKYEFLAISDAKDFSAEEYDGWTYYIPKERVQSEWDLYYVLLIEMDESDGKKVARRLGLGKVFKEAFENSCEPGKMWKEFILA